MVRQHFPSKSTRQNAPRLLPVHCCLTNLLSMDESAAPASFGYIFTSSLSIHLFAPSECKGITRIREDSSEIVFLLVENYQLTAFVGFGRRGIFGKHMTVICLFINASA